MQEMEVDETVQPDQFKGLDAALNKSLLFTAK